jgi:hypothetical protein
MRMMLLCVCAALALGQTPSDQKTTVEALRAKIEGKESLRSKKVFENVQWFGSAPAGRLLAMMEMGFSRGLGVDCSHCREINASLKKIEGLKGPDSFVNCTTRHRGELKPALHLSR